MGKKEIVRMTHQRKIILEELRSVTSHPTADDIYAMVKRRLPKISLGTIYRNLETLSVLGLVQKLEVGGTQKRFDGDISNHYHIRCTHCGTVEDIFTEPIASIEDLFKKVDKYKVTGYRLELFGVCPQCEQ